MATTRIIVKKNGSFRVEGDDFEIVDPTGKPYGLSGRTSISLCRCGQSQNKPFCDGSHRRVGFEADNPARDLPPPAPAPAEAPRPESQPAEAAKPEAPKPAEAPRPAEGTDQPD